jgi:peptidoglycan/LPS O-acetylase OafA/YrhL
LSDRLAGQENSFLLLRLLAACAVLCSHAFALVSGDPDLEPLRLRLGVTPGTLAVDVFFVVSGVLITQSLDRRQRALDFWVARALRILPALWAALLLTVLMGAVLGAHPAPAYWSDPQTWRYLLWNGTVVWRTAYELPGVFTGLPYAGAVNGSLWTLKVELRAYLGLFIAWALVQGFGRPALQRWVTLAVALALLGAHLSALRSVSFEASPWRLYAFFAMGSALYHWRDSVPFSTPLVALAGLLLAAGAAWPVAFGPAYTVALPLVVLGAALLPRGPVLNWNRMGDYSYGIYLYAFPVQQAVIQLCPGLGLLPAMAAALVLTASLAAVSWHGLEHPVMSWGQRWLRTVRSRPSA